MRVKVAGLRIAALLVFACATGTASADDFLLSWSSPSQNEDNTPLTNLNGYFIYVGATTDTMVPMYYIDATSTSLTIPSLQGGIGWYVAVTSLTTDGVESVKSPMLLVSAD
jgi:hypothetical protein